MTSTITRGIVAAAIASSMAFGPGFLASAEAAPVPAVTVVAKVGSKGAKVTTIQNDLKLLGYYTKRVDGDYGPVTASAVKRFQKAYKLKINGVVDSTTWNKLRSVSNAKRAAQKQAAQSAAKKAAAARARIVAKPGDKNSTVRAIQYRLATLGYMSHSDVIGVYGPRTTSAVQAFQKRNAIRVTGVVNGITHTTITTKYNNRPKTTTRPAVKLDSRCMTGRAICIKKSTQRMYWVVNGQIKGSWSVRTGRPSLATRSGSFKIYLKHPNWYSTLYHVNMPYTQFFSGGQAVHYSAEFARIGHSGAGSHGCVNMNSMSQARWLYNQTRVGDKVIVY